jgi:hypothetical protein
MRQFNDQDFYLAERAFKDKDKVFFNVFKNEAVKRLEYLKPLLDEVELKKMSLYHICYELSSEVEQLKELIQQEI